MIHRVTRRSLLLGVAGAAAASAPVRAARPLPLAIGTSTLGSVFYVQAVGLSKILRTHAGIRASVEAVGGAYANMFALGLNKIDLSIANALAAYDAFNALPPFTRRVELRLLAQGQESLRQIIVRRRARIARFEDLAGKTVVGKRPANREIWAIQEALLRVHGIPESRLRIVTTIDSNETFEAMEVGSVDAAMVPASRGAPELNRLIRSGRIAILPLPQEKVDAALQLLPPAITKSVLEPGVYEGQTEALNVFSIATVLVTSAALPEDTAYRTVSAIFDHPQDFAQFHRDNRLWTPARALDRPVIPFHPGAIRYFREKGLWDARMEEWQDKLLKT